MAGDTFFYFRNMIVKVFIVLSEIKRLNTNHYEKRLNLHFLCSNVACYADIESYPKQTVERADLEMTYRL